ncbi:MAG: isopentenyl-diphosphate delta-isomerase, partial [Nitrososphaerales archaeon]
CGTLIGILDDTSKIKLVEGEISDFKWVTLEELLSEIKNSPHIFCPWLLVALYFIPESSQNINDKHKEILKMWNRDDLKSKLEESLKHHFPDHKWELKKE